jgi:thioredoxin-like negative regulator of GroEL
MGRIYGEVTCDSCISYSNVVIDVIDSNRRPIGTYSVTANGDFDMIGIPEGNYIMTVRGANGMELASTSVSVRGESGPVSIQLPSSGMRDRTSKEASVSVHQLSHKVPKSAKKEFEKAVRAGDDHAKVIAHLKKAVEIDPEYIAALNNLGSRYIQIDQYENALEVLGRAQKIDPASPNVQTNIAVALLAMHKAGEAEHAARRAYQLASNDPRARYILALSLYTRQQFTEETVKLLESSREYFPNASIALGALYAAQGRTKEARGVLTGYLSSGHTAREPQVRQMLATLPAR